jgi:hypothetical protein
MAPKPLGLYTKKVSYHLRHPLEKFETEPKTFDKIWHGFCCEVDRGTSQIWRPQRRPAPDFCQDSHACDLGELLNKGRRTLPRVRRALSVPEHAQRPTPRASRRAKTCPCLLLAPAPIKPTEASTVLPRMLSTSPEPEITCVCPANGMT